MKKIVGVLLLVLLGLSFGNLVDEVKKLTPEEAKEIEKILIKKSIQRVGGDLVGGGYLQAVNMSSLQSAYSGTDKITYLYGGGGSILFPMTDQFSTGFKFQGGFNFTMNESSSKVFEDMYVGFGSVQFVIDYKLVQTKSFIFKTDVGIGGLLGGYNYHKTDENTSTSFSTYRYGLGLAYSVGADCLWVVESGVHVGVGLSYFNGKIDESRRILQTADATAPTLDFSGLALKFVVGMYL